MAKKIKVLFLSSDPRNVGYRPLMKKELREIETKIKSSPNSGLFDLQSEWALRPDDLQDALLRHRPHVAHISSHANRTEGIFLEDDSGEKKAVGARALAGLFGILKDNIRIVFLNACYTKHQMKVFTQTIDYTIGMNTPVGDKGAIVFAASFYRGLAYGLSVKTAFELAINQLELENIPDSKTPLLFVREGVDMSESFLRTMDAKSIAIKTGKAVQRIPRNSPRMRMPSSEPTRSVEPDKISSVRKKRSTGNGSMRKAADLELHRLIEELRANLEQLAVKVSKRKH